MRLLGLTVVGSGLFAFVDARHKQEKSYIGGLGVSAGLLTYAAFSQPAHLLMLRFAPMTLLGASLLYGFYNDDKAVLGGIATGYAAFLLAL